MAVFDIIIYLYLLLNYHEYIGIDKQKPKTTKQDKTHQKHTYIVQ